MSKVPQETLSNIITNDDGANQLVQEAEQLGKSFRQMGLTTAQIRALFGEVRTIQSMWQTERKAKDKDIQHGQALRRLILLKPKMAYRAQRERGKAVNELVDVLTPAVDLIIKEQNADTAYANFERFVEFFEAILAYHKAYGGR